MSYDILVGVGNTSVNSAISAFYAANPNVFSGSIDVGDGAGTLEWSITGAPTADLNPPQDAETQLGSLIADGAGNEFSSGQVAELASAAAAATLGLSAAGTGTLSSSGSSTSIDFSAAILGTASVNASGELQIDLLSLEFTVASHPIIQAALNGIVAPKLLKEFSGLSVQIPPLALVGVAMTPPVVVTQSDYLLVVANTLSSGTPSPPAPTTTLPSEDTFVVMSDPLREQVFRQLLAKAQDSFSGSGEADGFGYEYAVALGQPSITLGADSVEFSSSLSGTAGVFIKVFGAKITAGVKLYAAPNPSFTVAVTASGSDITVAVSHTAFAVVATPDGWDWILAPLLPVMEAEIAAALTAAIVSAVDGVFTKSFSLSSVPVTVAGATYDLEASALAVSTFQGNMMVAGSLGVAD